MRTQQESFPGKPKPIQARPYVEAKEIDVDMFQIDLEKAFVPRASNSSVPIIYPKVIYHGLVPRFTLRSLPLLTEVRMSEWGGKQKCDIAVKLPNTLDNVAFREVDELRIPAASIFPVDSLLKSNSFGEDGFSFRVNENTQVRLLDDTPGSVNDLKPGMQADFAIMGTLWYLPKGTEQLAHPKAGWTWKITQVKVVPREEDADEEFIL